MNDNILEENIEYTDELYQKAINENEFSNEDTDRVGDDKNGDN